MIKVGERVWNLERLYHNREGFTRQDNELFIEYREMSDSYNKF